MQPTYVLSLVDALRAERLRARSHFLSFLQAPEGKSAVCLNCGLAFDTCEQSESECLGLYATALRRRSGVAAARANRATKKQLREMARGFAWGAVVLIGIAAGYLYLAAR